VNSGFLLLLINAPIYRKSKTINIHSTIGLASGAIKQKVSKTQMSTG